MLMIAEVVVVVVSHYGKIETDDQVLLGMSIAVAVGAAAENDDCVAVVGST